MEFVKTTLARLDQDENSQLYVGGVLVAGAVILLIVAVRLTIWVLRLVGAVLGALRRGVLQMLYPLGHVPKTQVPVPEPAAPSESKSAQAPVRKPAQKKSKVETKVKAAPQPTPSQPAQKKAAAKEIKTIHSSGRTRQDTPSTQFSQVKGFRTGVTVTAVSPDPNSDMVFMGSEYDRTYKLFRASALGRGNDNVACRIEKATITHAAFDATGRVLATYVDNEQMVKVYSVRLDSNSTQLIWEAKAPLTQALVALGVGPGGGFAVLTDKEGTLTVLDRRGSKKDVVTNKLGTIRKLQFSPRGNMVGLCGTMSMSCKVLSVNSGSRSTMDDGPLWKGVTVEAYDHTSRKFYPAVVVDADGSDTYTIRWDEGGAESYHVPRKELRPTGVQTKGEDYAGIAHAMSLTGHKLGLTAMAFSLDGSRAVSCSEDGGIRLWDINVRWHISEDPKLLAQFADTDYCYFTHAAISPNNKILVLGTPSTSLLVYRLDTTPPTLLGEITDAHPQGSQFKEVVFVSKHVLLTVAHDDKDKAKLWDLATQPPPYRLN